MSPEEQIEAVTLSVLEQSGQEIADAVRDELDVSYPPASEPGHPPHRRTGRLQEGVSYIVRQEGSKTFLEVANDTPYAGYLEFGTDRIAPRPALEPMKDKFAPVIADRLETSLNK